MKRREQRTISKRIASWTLAVAMGITMLPVNAANVYAQTTGGSSASAGGDAFSAIGIDTSVAPDGFDANSIDNPYGRNTIKMNTVSELYTVKLEQDVSALNKESINVTANGTESAKGEVSTHTTDIKSANLTASLYGDGSGLKTITEALRSKNEGNVSTGNLSATGNYTKLNSGTHNSDSHYTYTDYLTGLNTAESEQGVMYDVAAGNFDGNKTGKSAQIAMVYTKAYSAKGGLYLKFGDAKGTGKNAYGTSSIELLSRDKKLGNPDLLMDEKKVENFAENPYQLKNYLQVATGDWDGDGVDEVAVYIPEEDNSRIAVYSLQKTGNDAYKSASNWALAWTYYLKEDHVVSNMISMTSGDVDRDGIDDLSCTWGYYYGPEQNKGSKAVVMFGAKDTDLLKRSQQFDITYGSSNIVRASFVFGDIGTGEEELILCGQADADLKKGNTYSRYVALYTWDGKQFVTNIQKNFDLFETDDDDKLVYSVMSRAKEKDEDTNKEYYSFYSLPLCPANTAIISKSITDDGSNNLYFDSLIFSYTKNGLELSQAWDTQSFMPGRQKKEYVEYDGTAGDMTGVSGAGTLMTVTQAMSANNELNASYKEVGGQVPVYGRESYYKNWFHKLIKKKSWRTVITGWKIGENTIAQKYTKNTWGETSHVMACPSDNNWSKKETVNSSFSFCFANTDNDSSYMNYAGEHYYRYTDPKVLAVLASPPYFKDLLNRDDLSGNYAESTTSYSSTTGSENGSTSSSTISIGAYVAFEQDISVFGIKIGSVESEATLTSNFTWETEHTSSLEQTVSYSASSGENKVALYSIPMEIYRYTAYVPDENGKYEEVISEVNIPHEACVKLMNLSEYESIAEDYSILPTIADSVLRHEIGDPSTYPSSNAGYDVIAEYTGTPASVGFTSKGGGDTIQQEIAMSESKGTSFSASASVEAKAGAGAGGVTVGVIAGSEGGCGSVSVSTSGSSFSGELQEMPEEARPYGYRMNWKIFCYRYKNSDMEFPVVSYIVSDVQQPASLPEDFAQDVAETTADSVTLTWSYDKYVSGFQIYRYYDFPDGNGSYRLEYVPFSKGVKNGDKYEFSFTDTGLSPYTEYQYQIQTESAYNPKVSIYSEPLSCRTKTTLGYPQMTVSGLVEDGKDAGKLAIYPDAEGKATVTVEAEEQYKSLSYQWQKYNGSEWVDLPAYKTNELTITNASAADKGIYRCRVNAIYFDQTSQKEFSISAYTQKIETVYTKRTPDGILTVSAQKYRNSKGIHAGIELHSANVGNITAPKGNVTFTIEGKDYENTRTVELVTSNTTKSFTTGSNHTENKYFSTASIDVSGLADGTYTVKYYYSGDNVFKDKTLEIGQIVAVGDTNGYALNLKDTTGRVVTKFTYGDTILPVLYTVAGGSSDTTEVTEGITYKYQKAKENGQNTFTADTKLDVGQYTLYAYVQNAQNTGSEESVASTTFTVEKKPLIVRAIPKDNVKDPTSTEDAPKLETNVEGVLAADLDVVYKVYNSAGNEVTLVSNMDPGNYTIIPCFKDTANAKRANYEITFEGAVYTIIGQTYRLTVSAEDYEGIKTVGTAAISATGDTKGQFARGTAVQLFATPDEGYEVDKWTVDVTGKETVTYTADQLQNPNRLNLGMEAGETKVNVYFKKKKIKLNLINTTGGKISCTDTTFKSGATVNRGAKFTFKAEPAPGYSFGHWVISETGQNAVFDNGTSAEDGTNTIDITVGTNNIGLQATFIRDSYTVNLVGDVNAYYLKESNDADTEPEKVYITDGKAVKGDTTIYVEPKKGYVAAEGASITINDQPTGETSAYSFALKENTTIALDTVRENYVVTADAQSATEGVAGGRVVITENGVETASGNQVAGGSKVVFQAIAARGYVFDHWIIGEKIDSTADVYTIDEIGEAVSMTAVFRKNIMHKISGSVLPENRGKLVYTLYDIYGNVIEENKDYTSEIEMYQGESIEFTAAVNDGSMVEQWTLTENGKVNRYVSSAKRYPGGRITMKESDIEIKAVLVASTYYDMYFNAEQTPDVTSSGSISATVDGAGAGTGSTVPGGADVVFTAVPDDGMMVDHWTITEGDASVMPTAENTTTVTDSEGNPFVDPVYKIEGYKGNLTIRVYFTPIVTRILSITGANAVSSIDYVTPVKAEDATEPTDPAVSFAEIRQGATVKLTLTPNAGYVTTVNDVKSQFAGMCASVNVTYNEAEGSYSVELKNVHASENMAIDTDTFVDSLWTVATDGKSHTISELTSSKATENVPEGKVRNNAAVTFKLVPASGYQLNEEALTTWAAENGLRVTLNEDKSVTVTVDAIQSDIISLEKLFVKIEKPDDGNSGGGNSGGSTGGGGGGMTPIPPTDDSKKDDDKKDDNKTPADNDSAQEAKKVSVTVNAVATKEEGTVQVKLTKKQQNALITKAVKENAKEVVIETGELSEELKETTETVKVTVRKEFVEALQDADVALSIETPNGKIQLDTDTLQVVSEQSDGQNQITLNFKKEKTKDYRKIVGTKAYVVSVELYAGDEKISDFGDGTIQMKLEIPKSLVNSKIEAIYIANDGTIQRFKDGRMVTEKTTDKNGKVIETKYYCFETNHFSVYALAKKTAVNAYAKQLKEINGVKKTGVTLTAKASSKTVKFTWKKTKTNQVDGYEVYCATSKKGKYTKVYTTENVSVMKYTDSRKTSKTGKTYYYKVRGYKVIGGKKYYTKWSNIVTGI